VSAYGKTHLFSTTYFPQRSVSKQTQTEHLQEMSHVRQDATQPVVLAPASAAHAHAEAGVMKHSAQSTPVVRFGVVRSFANSLVTSAAEGAPSAPASPAAAPIALRDGRRDGSIMSFRSLYLEVGEIDVQTDGKCLASFGLCNCRGGIACCLACFCIFDLHNWSLFKA
jgi:hypothetical protein